MNDYITEVEKQLFVYSYIHVYKQVSFKEKNLCDFLGKSNRFLRGLKLDGHISENEMEYFIYQYKKVTSLGKLYILPKIYNRLYNIPGRSVISNCGATTEKVAKFLDYHFRPIMQDGWPYFNDTEDFLKKVQNMRKIPQDSILLTADVVGLYPSIPHNASLNALKVTLDCRLNKKTPIDVLVKMAEFVLTNKYF